MLRLHPHIPAPEPRARYGVSSAPKKRSKKAAARRTRANLSGGLSLILGQTHLFQGPPRTAFWPREQDPRAEEERDRTGGQGWGRDQS